MTPFKKAALMSIGALVAAGAMSASALAASIVSFNGPAGEAYIGKFIKGNSTVSSRKA